MGFPSVCYEYVLLLLVTKEAVLASGLVKLGGKSKQRYVEKVGRVEETPCNCRRRKMPVTSQNLTSRSQPHGDTQINRNGLI